MVEFIDGILDNTSYDVPVGVGDDHPLISKFYMDADLIRRSLPFPIFCCVNHNIKPADIQVQFVFFCKLEIQLFNFFLSEIINRPAFVVELKEDGFFRLYCLKETL